MGADWKSAAPRSAGNALNLLDHGTVQTIGAAQKLENTSWVSPETEP
jgi:hypothetical protein